LRVLLVTPMGMEVLGVIGRSIAGALEGMGHTVCPYDFRSGRVMAGGVGAALKRAFRPRLPFSPRSLPVVRWVEGRKRAAALLDACEAFRPDMVLTLKGEGLGPDLMKKVKALTGAVMVNWFQDTVTIPMLRDLAVSVSPGYDFFFGIDDQGTLDKAGLRTGVVKFLPMGFDPDVYKRVELSFEEAARYGSDVAFVGTMVPARVKAFEALKLKGLKLWGPPVTVHGDWLAGSPGLARAYTGQSALGEEAAKVYSASKVVLSMHGNFGEAVSNVTPRVFEVPACGGFLVTDYHPQLELFYDVDTEMACYRDLPGLRRKLDYYLGKPEERAEMAGRAMRRALTEHTYKDRLKAMIGLVEGRREDKR
jgi:spore maturation protein CgeB